MALVGTHVPNTGGSTSPIAGVPYDAVMNAVLSVGYEAYFGIHQDLDFLYRAARVYPASMRQIRWGNETPGGDEVPFNVNPTGLADYIAQWYLTEKTAPAGVTPIDHVVHHCTGNEANLEGRFRGYPEDSISADWAGLNEWLASHYIRLRSNMSGRGFKLHFPALAPTGGDEYNGIRACRNSLSYCDVLDIHCYGHTRWEWVGGRTSGAWQRDPNYDPRWWQDPNYGSSFMRYRQLLNEMGFKQMPINITEFNRAWFDTAWYDSISPENRPVTPPPEPTQDAIDYAAEVIEYRRHLDRNRRSYNLMSACGFIWASSDERFRAFSWMRGAVQEPVVAAERGYIPSDRPIGGVRGVLPLAIIGMAAVGMMMAQQKGVLG